MQNKSFKETVRKKLIACSQSYLSHFVSCRYLIYSENFLISPCYTISAKEDNYLHLTGVITSLSAKTFFTKCLNGSLSCNDFDLGNTSNKGTIRRKISVLDNAVNLFTQSQIIIEEDFHKNHISCSFISTDGSCTLGFILIKNAKPKTLMKGNMIKNPIQAELVLRLEQDNNYKILINNQSLTAEEIEAVITQYK